MSYTGLDRCPNCLRYAFRCACRTDINGHASDTIDYWHGRARRAETALHALRLRLDTAGQEIDSP